MDLSESIPLNPYCPCPNRCSPHQPGMGWPLMVHPLVPEDGFWCENCNASFTAEQVWPKTEGAKILYYPLL